MMRDWVGEAGAEFDTFLFGHGAEDVETDSFGYVVEEENADVSTKGDGGHLRFILTQAQEERDSSLRQIGGLAAGAALAGGFVEEDCSGSGCVERLDAGRHGDADASVGAALDFFGKARAFVADQQRYGPTPVYLPGS
jgi:hypothetical protein